MRGSRVYRSAPIVVFLLVACAGPRTPQTSAAPSDAGPTAPGRSVPDHVFGVELRKPLNAVAFSRHACTGARDFAYRRGFYSTVTDDVLFGVPHEHQDTIAVLAALDSFTVCVGETRDLNAIAIVTLFDSVVGNAHIFWPDASQAPGYDRMLTNLMELYGEPFQNEYGVRFWSADSMKLYINRRGFYTDGTALDLSDARVCDRFERLVHRQRAAPVYVDSLGNPDPRSNYCWVRPKQ